MEHRPDIGVFVGDGHYACEPMVTGLDARGLILVSKLRRDASLFVPWTEPPTGRPGRPRPHRRVARGRAAGRGQTAASCTTVLQALRATAAGGLRPGRGRGSRGGPQADHPVQHRPGDGPKRIFRIHVDRFQIEFNFRDYRQHLGLAACQARTAERHHFHLNAVLAALAWTRRELRHAARALDRFSMANVKPRTSRKWCWPGFLHWSGRTLQEYPEALRELLELGPIEPKPT